MLKLRLKKVFHDFSVIIYGLTQGVKSKIVPRGTFLATLSCSKNLG